MALIMSRTAASPAQHQENLAATRQTKAMLDRLSPADCRRAVEGTDFAGIRRKPILRFAASLCAKPVVSGEPLTTMIAEVYDAMVEASAGDIRRAGPGRAGGAGA
jgi:hypothetical protein